ncbi:tryptophan 7-halogenase [Mesorhizobium sp. M0012]|uniref:tryptophan 7-halogenase n=1 Tax=Mesorhizobium sp. M0012 TaxID=2956840 RepID=UPI0033372F14
MARRSADVLIVGAGPSGCASAIGLLQRGRSVILLDRGAFETRPGEGLPGAARGELSALGLWESFLSQGHNAVWSVRSAWGSAELVSQELAFHPYGQNWHLDREAFDGLCRARAEELGATMLKGALAGAHFVDGRWLLTVDRAPFDLSVRFVIDASGRASAFARRQGVLRRRRDRLVGLASTFADRLSATGVFSTTIEATPDGWWYAAQLPHGLVTAVYMTDAESLPPGRGRLTEFWVEQICMTSHICCVAGPPDAVEVRAWPADSAVLDQAYGNSWFAVGDAVCSFDPLSSTGIIHALESGAWVACAIDDTLRGKSSASRLYGTRIRQRIRDFERLKFAYYGAERRWSSSKFWSRRQATSEKIEKHRWNW